MLLQVKMVASPKRVSIKQGKRMTSQTKEIILNVYEYFQALSKKTKKN